MRNSKRSPLQGSSHVHWPLVFLLPSLLLIPWVPVVLVSTAWAQTPSADDRHNSAPLAVGQTFENVTYPSYVSATNNTLANTFHAERATGITPNRARAQNVTIDVYEVIHDTNTVTTVITSPDADIMLNDRIMRTTNSVCVKRDQMIATAQRADFDLSTKHYTLRRDVKITLLNFDIGKAASPSTNNTPSPAPAPSDTSAPAPPAPASPDQPIPTLPALPQMNADQLPPLIFDKTPGAASQTNSPPSQ